MNVDPIARTSNRQRPEKPQQRFASGNLDVHSIFQTIQGEGPHAGRPAVFIRLAGCNLQCPQCDTDYTSQRKWMTPAEIVFRARAGVAPDMLAVITGGEPFRQNLGPVLLALRDAGFAVQIETNGTLDCEQAYLRGVDVVVSPKTGKVHPRIEQHATAYKYVINAGTVDPSDGLPTLALGHPVHNRVARPPVNFGGSVYVQPADEGIALNNSYNLKACIESVRRFGYRLCLQQHKIIGLP